MSFLTLESHIIRQQTTTNMFVEEKGTFVEIIFKNMMFYLEMSEIIRKFATNPHQKVQLHASFTNPLSPNYTI